MITWKRIVRRILREITPPPKPPFGVTNCLSTLKQLGFSCNFCVDIGAYHGEWTRTLKNIFPGSSVLMLEAQLSKQKLLEQVAAAYSDVFVEVALLGPVTGELVSFHSMETGSSVLAETSPFPRQTTECTTSSLDDLLRAGSRPKVDLLKLDVQGYELEVLKGGKSAVQQADVIVLEASLLAINAGCPLLPEVVSSLTGMGFRLFDIYGLTRRTDGVLWQTDLVFIRDDAPFLPTAELTAVPIGDGG